ncbi:butyrate kinase [Kosmotoga arenicorallina S304]|uniref:Probable butyrate kinase n=1 Tax=Kosmotoga arenicorallina S304 TaxID=1453497 RepID=A0A176K445_9BACT|nr:butyrate kinase [Kosmotoga arenicorallina]OAA31887.1 butyrate kinase [Kosmotoga arenicorallina S304]
MRILVINPGSTSTKLGIYENNTLIRKEYVKHSPEEEENMSILQKVESRSKTINQFLEKNGYRTEDFDAIACRGGILPPLESGTYQVDEDMVQYLLQKSMFDHPSNYAAPIGMALSKEKIPVFITDPVSVDELCPEARLSGIPQLKRLSLFHALNMKAVAREVAKEMGSDIKDLTFVIAHLGGGISVGLQAKGKMIDVNNSKDEGPFGPNRTGDLPVGDVVEKAFSGEFTEKELIKRYSSKGGLISYLGTDNLREVLDKSKYDNYAKQVLDAMIYQIAKEIGGLCAIAGGDIDAIILTGGMAYNSDFVERIKSYISNFGLVVVKPGDNELLSLAQGAERVLNGEEEAKHLSLEGIL